MAPFRTATPPPLNFSKGGGFLKQGYFTGYKNNFDHENDIFNAYFQIFFTREEKFQKFPERFLDARNTVIKSVSRYYN